ncbi:MAG: PHP domain-containing protein [Candidatus Eremiobacterota bacterium]
MTILTFDLHIHSKYSKDSIMSPAQIIKIAKEKKLTGIAVTDHNTIRGGIEVKKKSDKDLFVIVGSEIKTDRGEIIGLFLNEEIRSKDFFEVVDDIKGQGGKCVLPHPYRNHYADPASLISYVDAIEGFNSRNPKDFNIKAQNLARSQRIVMTAGSDAHMPFEIGYAMTCIEEKNFYNQFSILSKATFIQGNNHSQLMRFFLICAGKSTVILKKI